MRFSRPSTGTILGAIALFIALGGTAAAATGTLVNIADPTNSASVAHVTSSGRLETAGSDSVTNTVSTELAAPSTFVNSALASVAGSCVVVATPPAGKAMIVREVMIDVYEDPSPGTGQAIFIFTGTNCTGNVVGDVNPPTVGETTLPFDPGLGIPANSGLSALDGGVVDADVFAEGYAVPSSQVAALRLATTGSQALQQQR